MARPIRPTRPAAASVPVALTGTQAQQIAALLTIVRNLADRVAVLEAAQDAQLDRADTIAAAAAAVRATLTN